MKNRTGENSSGRGSVGKILPDRVAPNLAEGEEKLAAAHHSVNTSLTQIDGSSTGQHDKSQTPLRYNLPQSSGHGAPKP